MFLLFLSSYQNVYRVGGKFFFLEYIQEVWISQVALVIKNNLPDMQEPQEMQVHSLGREDPVEEEMATHSSILAWEIPWTEEPGGL